MSFNTAALCAFPQVVPVPRSERPEPLRPHHRRASTMAQVTSTQSRHDALTMPRFDPRTNVQPHEFSRGYDCMWNDVEVQNDWAIAAGEQKSAYQLQVERVQSYEQRARERNDRQRASFDSGRGRRVSVDRIRERRGSVDRGRERRGSFDRRHDLRVTVERERGRCKSTGRHHRHASDSSASLRPPVSALSFNPPTKCRDPRRPSFDREREHRVSVDRRHDLRVVDRERGRCKSSGRHHRHASDSSASLRPPVSALSFKPPTKCRDPRRPSFDYATVRDCSHGRQYPIYILPPPAPAPEIYFPSQRRDRTSVEAVRRLPYPSIEVTRFEKPTKLSGLARFNPFHRLFTASISTAQKELMRDQPKVHTNRLRRKSNAGRA
ncbi:hypothetical protein K503DRAFT_802950 [Rhizopogon vinicolor AM-OR11-026]|uniref:Uncharacterized protein n=1 Tax=Rhizopogon vinicolor AM-OR11-026 TaxID=1314800 RepID=A0A1B7MRR5_9AGAM|nr:hypothetical protein K503DRAFT_802950 [Rhizopogon vinicolor AM-OR11-026]